MSRKVKTGAEKALIALVVQAAFAPLLGVVAGGAVAIAFFLGREVAQHEYKLAFERGWSWGPPPPVKWYEGLTKGWSLDSTLDLAFPLAAVLAFVAASVCL